MNSVAPSKSIFNLTTLHFFDTLDYGKTTPFLVHSRNQFGLHDDRITLQSRVVTEIGMLRNFKRAVQPIDPSNLKAPSVFVLRIYSYMRHALEQVDDLLLRNSAGIHFLAPRAEHGQFDQNQLQEIISARIPNDTGEVRVHKHSGLADVKHVRAVPEVRVHKHP